MLLSSDYKAYHLSSSGWITRMEDEKKEFTIVCPKCGMHHKMVITERGLTPIELAEDKDDPRSPILRDNPIGNKENKE